MGAIELEPGAVHVWEADLQDVPDGLMELLSPEERARAAAILPPRPRLLWPRSRALLRLLLARYTGISAEALVLETGPDGKPQLGGPLHFNLSHGGGLALYALSSAGPVGVDVERTGRRPDEFLRSWTRREATAKCLGTGLRGSVALGAGSAETPPPGQIPAPEQAWVSELELEGPAVGALACLRAPTTVHLRRWEPGA